MTPEKRETLLGSRQGVEGVIAVVREMDEQELWFQVRTPEKANQLIPLILPLVSEYRRRIDPYKKPGALNATENNACGIADKIAQLMGREEEWNAAEAAVAHLMDCPGSRCGPIKAIRRATETTDPCVISPGHYDADFAALDACRAAAWETISDVVPENPFKSLLGLYRLGLVNIYLREVDGKERLVAHFPLSLPNGKRVMGCWTEGDQELYFFHNWGQNCESLTSLDSSSLSHRAIRPRK